MKLECLFAAVRRRAAAPPCEDVYLYYTASRPNTYCFLYAIIVKLYQ